MSRRNSSATIEHERMVLPMLEVRVDETGDRPKIQGYPIVFDSWSVPIRDWLGEFKEIVRQGAFTKTLRENKDIKVLWNHDTSKVLGRTKNNTATLTEDERGVFVTAEVPDTTFGRDAIESVRRGDVDQGSFMFRVVTDKWSTDGGMEAREVIEASLLEASFGVTFPAYSDTSSNVRSAFHQAGIDMRDVNNLLRRLNRGEEANGQELTVIRETIDFLQDYLPDGPAQGRHSSGSDDDPTAQVRTELETLTRKLEIVSLRLEDVELQIEAE